MAVSSTNNQRIVGFPRFNVGNAFPTMMHVKFPYVSQFNINNPTAGTIGAVKRFQLNSLFNPEPVGGHQPYSFDQLCSAIGPYERYKVTGVTVDVMVSSANSNPAYIVTQLRNIVDAYSIGGQFFQEALEKPTVRADFCPSAGPQMVRFRINLPTLAPLFNWNQSTFNLDMGQTTAPYNATPASFPELQFACCGVSTASGLAVSARFMFDATLYQRETLPTS